jgi:hypothetical protein
MRKKSILVVDDDRGMLYALVQLVAGIERVLAWQPTDGD